jgi:hypothetical protein
MPHCVTELFDSRLAARGQDLPRISRANQSMLQSASTASRRGVFQGLRRLAACRRLLILAAAALVLALSPQLSTQVLAAPPKATVGVGNPQIGYGGEPRFCAFNDHAQLPTWCVLPIWPDDPPVWRVLPL